jgi:CDP-glucose 4,6-dehydratase
MTPAFWSGKRVLLTGHTGFKGAWLSLWLSELGADVTGYALPPDEVSLFAQANVGSRVRSVFADIRDLDRVAATMRDARPDIVIHMAAQSLVRRSYEVPVETFGVNAMGTAHVLEAARMIESVRTALIVTTDKCYENREWTWGYRETDGLGGHDPYSASKACAELVTTAYRRSFFGDSGRGVASARAGNVIGGGDWARDRIVPDIARAALRSEPATVRNPRSIRPWQHVLDVLLGYLQLVERLYEDPARYSDAWNFGPSPDDVRSVAELADALCGVWPGAAWAHEGGVHPHETSVLTLDATKARRHLSWRPRLAFHDAVRWSADWYRRHRDDPGAVTLEQLKSYAGLP